MAHREHTTDHEAKQLILEIGRRMYQKNCQLRHFV